MVCLRVYGMYVVLHIPVYMYICTHECMYVCMRMNVYTQDIKVKVKLYLDLIKQHSVETCGE
jgi:hypothetical protein